MRFPIGIVLGALVVSISAEHEQPWVKTPLGGIRGYYNTSFNGRSYRAFEGIPYAQPPVGELRFEPPQRFGSWPGTLLATRLGASCLQYTDLPTNPPERVEGSEDCLYLNIYTNVPEDTTKLFPVVFYLHGGAFQYSSGGRQRPDYVMDRDFVLVTVNYRLGILGFLSTEDEVIPGNMGLKDQSLALRWVSENIKYFGGDPGKVTIAGLSAGGASVHYHYLSPLSRGLFHAGMSFSGTALDCWTQTEASLAKAKTLAATLGCPIKDTKDLATCLKRKPATSIVQLAGDFLVFLYNPFTPFGPVIEAKTNHSFIDRSPIDIIASGDAVDVPWLTTVTSEEGLYPVASFITNEELMEQLDSDWGQITPYLLDFNYTIPKYEQAHVAKKIRKYYLGDRKIDISIATPLIHMVGDRLFTVDAERAARLMAKANRSPVWFYLFNFRPEFSLSDAYIPSKEKFGVSHADDVILVIAQQFFPPVTEESTIQIQNILLNLWSSFAANGAPDIGVDWPPINPNSKALKYLKIMGPDMLKVERNENLGNKKFWRSINFNENK